MKEYKESTVISAYEEFIVISTAEYDVLQDRDIWLAALEAAGLDNWDGIDQARDILSEWQLEDEQAQVTSEEGI